MSDGLPSPEETRTAAEIMARHAKTFSWANRLMPPEYRHDFAVLYAFCRGADDCVDEAPDFASARDSIDRMRGDVARRASHDPMVAAFLAMAARRRIPLRIADELLIGIASDIGTVRIQDWGELHRYAYRVASTVGLMVCSILGVEEPQARAFAIDLGIGMQLTNIARDVIEDYGNDRIYLPAVELDVTQLQAAIERRDVETARHAHGVVLRVLDDAALYYRSSDNGIAWLPAWARWGILTASRCYEDIGGEIRRAGAAGWTRRAHTSKLRKLCRTVQALLLVSTSARYRRPPAAKCPRSVADGQPARMHDPLLHRHLRGLPDAMPPSSDGAPTGGEADARRAELKGTARPLGPTRQPRLPC